MHDHSFFLSALSARQGGKACDAAFSRPQYNASLKANMMKSFWVVVGSLQQGEPGFITGFKEWLP